MAADLGGAAMPSSASLPANPANQNPTNLQYGETSNHSSPPSECFGAGGVWVCHTTRIPDWIQDQESKLIRSSFQDNN